MKKLNIVSYNEAIKRSKNLLIKENEKENVSLLDSLKRVLAKTVTCKKDLPAFNNSAMDGFAFKHKNISQKLKIATTIYAGNSVESCLGISECYKIMTGAKVPDDADTVIPFEDCISYNEEEIEIGDSTKKGSAFRVKGEEQKKGDILLKKGAVLTSGHIAMLASQGINSVEVYRKITVAIFSTGDELKEPWESANSDEIYNVNSSALISLLKENNFQADYCGVIPDNLEKSIKYFKHMSSYDAIVTTGGISMGEADFVKEALKVNGFKSAFHGVNIKPGRPTMMGIMGNTLVASMPGNPLAAYVNAFLFLIPSLRRLQGVKDVSHNEVLASNYEEFSVKPKRVNIVLGLLENGTFQAFCKNRYGSGMVTPILKSNAIFVTDENSSIVGKGDTLKVFIFR